MCLSCIYCSVIRSRLLWIWGTICIITYLFICLSCAFETSKWRWGNDVLLGRCMLCYFLHPFISPLLSKGGQWGHEELMLYFSTSVKITAMHFHIEWKRGSFLKQHCYYNVDDDHRFHWRHWRSCMERRASLDKALLLCSCGVCVTVL